MKSCAAFMNDSPLLSVLWLSQAHWWHTSSFAALLSFQCTSLYLRCLCVSVSYDLFSYLSTNLVCSLTHFNITCMFSLSFLKDISLQRKYLTTLFSDAYIRALYYHLSILYLFLLLYISLSVFSLLCLKQRKQWTWCLIMQISSGLISLHNSIHNLINELANNIVAFLARVIKRPRKFWAHFVHSKW